MDVERKGQVKPVIKEGLNNHSISSSDSTIYQSLSVGVDAFIQIATHCFRIPY